VTPVQRLLADYGQLWRIERADLDTWVASRTIGTRSRVIAGPPAELIRKLDMEPCAAGTIVRQDSGGWLNGPMIP
jgi:hypothetical protein